MGRYTLSVLILEALLIVGCIICAFLLDKQILSRIPEPPLENDSILRWIMTISAFLASGMFWARCRLILRLMYLPMDYSFDLHRHDCQHHIITKDLEDQKLKYSCGSLSDAKRMIPCMNPIVGEYCRRWNQDGYCETHWVNKCAQKKWNPKISQCMNELMDYIDSDHPLIKREDLTVHYLSWYLGESVECISKHFYQ